MYYTRFKVGDKYIQLIVKDHGANKHNFILKFDKPGGFKEVLDDESIRPRIRQLIYYFEKQHSILIHLSRSLTGEIHHILQFPLLAHRRTEHNFPEEMMGIAIVVKELIELIDRLINSAHIILGYYDKKSKFADRKFEDSLKFEFDSLINDLENIDMLVDKEWKKIHNGIQLVKDSVNEYLGLEQELQEVEKELGKL
ncbi:MAG: hypothetical protein ABIC04_06120 [Nanoarchaeota archaeon]